MSTTITVVGNIAADPEQRTTAGGNVYTAFRIGATPRRYDADRGAWVDEGTSWYRVHAYKGLGAHALASLHRGERVIVTGRLTVREWESGERRSLSVEISADAIGHDLLWGTSAFRPDVARGRAADAGSRSQPADAEPTAATPRQVTAPADWPVEVRAAEAGDAVLADPTPF